MTKKLLPVILLFSVFVHAQIIVDDTYTTQQLVEDVLVNSTCAQVSNFVQVTGTDFGDDNGIGFLMQMDLIFHLLPELF